MPSVALNFANVKPFKLKIPILPDDIAVTVLFLNEISGKYLLLHIWSIVILVGFLHLPFFCFSRFLKIFLTAGK